MTLDQLFRLRSLALINADVRALMDELKDRAWWEQTAVRLQRQRDEAQAYVRELEMRLLKASPEHQAQMKWARDVVSTVVIPPAGVAAPGTLQELKPDEIVCQLGHAIHHRAYVHLGPPPHLPPVLS